MRLFVYATCSMLEYLVVLLESAVCRTVLLFISIFRLYAPPGHVLIFLTQYSTILYFLNFYFFRMGFSSPSQSEDSYYFSSRSPGTNSSIHASPDALYDRLADFSTNSR